MGPDMMQTEPHSIENGRKRGIQENRKGTLEIDEKGGVNDAERPESSTYSGGRL